MTILHTLRLMVRRLGIDIHCYNVLESAQARVVRLLDVHGIDLVLDVGANNGGFANEIRQAGYRGRILSFEPLENVNQRLAMNAAADSNWRIAPVMALGAEDGSTTINIAGNSASSSLLPMKSSHSEAAPQTRYIGQQQVSVRRLDGLSDPFIDGARSIYLKIDTQGYEYPVLLGSKGLLPRVAGIQLELSLIPLYEGQRLYRELIDAVTAEGFELCCVLPGFTDPRNGRMLQMDGIFFRA